jgi:hypothetical protein
LWFKDTKDYITFGHALKSTYLCSGGTASSL